MSAYVHVGYVWLTAHYKHQLQFSRVAAANARTFQITTTTTYSRYHHYYYYYLYYCYYYYRLLLLP